jgi:hypothetical protein
MCGRGRVSELFHMHLVGTVSQVTIFIVLHERLALKEKLRIKDSLSALKSHDLALDNRRQNDQKPKVKISPKVKGWRCPKLFFP